ncbi:reeler domain-containing lethal (2) 34Fc [Rhynchophorus ferrugineus]|uniref:Reelin domain-containing protein n=1 Tax=Rhynchophorus ferrugineus TaxID=354439 RepID=A0A834HVG1_RHYFE|nr:hypothetical protein GWI33_017683 [Rhynchophorus ferrugineus]
MKLIIITVLSVAATAWGYSAGAPESVCDDMKPKHPVDPQTIRFPYKIALSKNEVAPGEDIEITISGRSYLGVFLQFRNSENQAIGSFQISPDDKYFKTVKCHENKLGAATHKNKEDKKDKVIVWKAPDTAGKYTLYATVAENGGVFWVAKPSGTINVA